METQESSAKTVATFFIFLSGLAGAGLPPFIDRCEKMSATLRRYSGLLQHCFAAFGAGVVIATALVHILPDGMKALDHGLVTHNGGQILVDQHGNLVVTSEMMAALTRGAVRTSSSSSSSIGGATTTTTTSSPTSGGSDGSHHFPAGCFIALIGLVGFHLIKTEMQLLASAASGPSTKIHTTEAGVAIHSILIGVAFGTEDNAQTAKVLSVALCFHQLCEGLAMGPMILSGMRSLLHGTVLVLIFAATSPFGILIGEVATAYGDPHSSRSREIEGIFSLLAAGLLMYVGCAEFLAPLADHPAFVLMHPHHYLPDHIPGDEPVLGPHNSHRYNYHHHHHHSHSHAHGAGHYLPVGSSNSSNNTSVSGGGAAGAALRRDVPVSFTSPAAFYHSHHNAATNYGAIRDIREECRSYASTKTNTPRGSRSPCDSDKSGSSSSNSCSGGHDKANEDDISNNSIINEQGPVDNNEDHTAYVIPTHSDLSDEAAAATITRTRAAPPSLSSAVDDEAQHHHHHDFVPDMDGDEPDPHPSDAIPFMFTHPGTSRLIGHFSLFVGSVLMSALALFA